MKKSLSEDEKRAFDAIKSMADFWWNRFEHRTTIYMRFNVSIWGALIAFIGIIFTGKLNSSHIGKCPIVIASLIFGFSIIGIHFLIMKGLGRAHKLDRDKFNDYENGAMAVIDHKYDTDIQTRIEAAKKSQTSIFQWSHLTHLLITIFLVILSILLFVFIQGE